LEENPEPYDMVSKLCPHPPPKILG